MTHWVREEERKSAGRGPLVEAAGKVEGIAPRDDFRDFAGVGGADGKVEDAAGSGGGEEGHFGFEFKMMAGGEPGAEPGAADEAEAALAVGDAGAAEEGGHGAIGPAAGEGHAGGVGEAVADNEVGVMAKVPEAFEVAGIMLAVTVEEKEPVDGGAGAAQGMTEGGGFAVARAGEGEDFGAGPGGEAGSVVAAGVIDDADCETGAAATAHDAADGGGLVAGRDENQGGGLGAGGVVHRRGPIRRPRACRLG